MRGRHVLAAKRAEARGRAMSLCVRGSALRGSARTGKSRTLAGVVLVNAWVAAAWAQTCPPAPCSTSAQCDDGNYCTRDACIGTSCFCDLNHQQCDDGVFCNGSEFCDAATGSTGGQPGSCREGTPVSCAKHCSGGANYGQECITDSQCPDALCIGFCSDTLSGCRECETSAHCTTNPRLRCSSSGECVQCTSHGQCQDGSFCNGFESCNSSTGLCEAGTSVACQQTCFRGSHDDLPCTTDANCPGGMCLGFCSEARAACVQCELAVDCDDGQFCNGDESCTNDQCQASDPPVCKHCVGGVDQGLPCAVDAECDSPGTCAGEPSYCHEPSNACVQCLNPGHCEDFNFCTTNACVFNACVFSPDSAICSDGRYCNGEEVCHYLEGNPCSLFQNAAHCCFKGLCDPPTTCSADAQCLAGQTCLAGVCSPYIGCYSSSDCQSGQTCRNDSVPQCNDDIHCTADSCNETIDSCQSIASDARCTDGLACNGTETCNPEDPHADATGCIDGAPVDCSHLDTECSTGSCVEVPHNPPVCASQATNEGGICQDANPCTAISTCSDGSYVDSPPADNDPYRCVHLEFRPSTLPSVPVGTTIELGLYAVATGCNVKRCTGGANAGQACGGSADCPLGTCSGTLTWCEGGDNDGQPCAIAGDCPAGTCSTPCEATGLPIISIEALLTWSPAQLELQTSTGPQPNPEDPCGQNLDPCTTCPTGQYAWGFSGWIADCGGEPTQDDLNAPCFGTPSNDGNARYLAHSSRCHDLTAPPTACATATGLHVTTFKFKAISGSTTGTPANIGFLRPPLPADQAQSCYGQGSKTTVQSAVLLPTVPTTDVTKSVGAAVSVTITCDEDGDCNDGNVCTTDHCSCTTPGCEGVCAYLNNTLACSDERFCTLHDMCSGGNCVGTGSPCSGSTPHCDETSALCVQCLTDAHCNTDGMACTVEKCVNHGCQQSFVDCDDGVACTIDECVEPTPRCMHTPDDSVCNPAGLFCTAAVCDVHEGCVFHHKCFSENGNPCPDPATCDESTNTCGACLQPSVTPIGARYLDVTPANQGSTPVALLVTGDCGDSIAACVFQYVQSKCSGGPNNGQICADDANCPKACQGGSKNGVPCMTNANCPPTGIGVCLGFCEEGSLGSAPVYKTSAQWGTVKVRGAQIRPGTRYFAHAECDFEGGGGLVLSNAGRATTWRWGDTEGDGDVEGPDIAASVNSFKGIAGAPPFERVNLWGCTPDGIIDGLDIASAVDAFKGFAYPCSWVCP